MDGWVGILLLVGLALLAVPVLLYLARHTRRRMRQGHTDSVWSQ